jgi:Protein of unknown function (DUF2975)
MPIENVPSPLPLDFVLCTRAFSCTAFSRAKSASAILAVCSRSRGPAATVPAPPACQRIGLLLLLVLQIAVLFVALHALWKMFGLIASGEALSQATASWMRRAGLCFAASAALMIVLRPLHMLLATISAPPGQRMVSVGFGTPELLAFLLAAVLMVLGHVQMLAAEISDDNRQIV